MHYVRFVLFVVWGVFIFPVHTFAQSNSFDSEDAIVAYIDSVNALSFQQITSSPDRLEPDFLRSIELADSINYNEGKANSLAQLSTLYNYLGKYDISLESHLEAIRLFQDLGMREKVGYQYSELGYRMRRRNIEQGAMYMRKGIKILEEFPGSANQSNAFNNYGVIKLDLGELDSARYFINRSMDIKVANDDSLGIAYSYGNLGAVENEAGEFRKAVEYLKKAYSIRSNIGDSSGMAIDLHNIGFGYISMGDTTTALTYLKRSLKMASDVNYWHLAEFNYGSISEVFEMTGQLDSALAYQKQFVEYRTQRINESTNERIAELEVQYETEQKEKEIAVKEAALSQEQLKVRQRTFILVSLAGILFSGLIIGVLYVRQQSIKEENLKRENRLKLQLADAELANKIHKERERISKDLHDNVGSHITNLIAGIEVSNLHIRKQQRDKAVELLQALDGDARNAMSELRETIWLLDRDSVKISDFTNHLKSYISTQRTFLGDLNISITSNELIADQELTPEQSLHLFRIIQESLNNTRKYANATEYGIKVEGNKDALKIRIHDDGEGFTDGEVKGSGNGLRNMKDRTKAMGGTFRISHETGKGVSITIQIPVNEQHHTASPKQLS